MENFILLYVCDGNVARSFAMEIVTRAEALEMGIVNLVVKSAGLGQERKEDRTPIAEMRREVSEALFRQGYPHDYYGHIPRQVNRILMAEANLILCPEDTQVDALKKRARCLEDITMSPYCISTLPHYAENSPINMQDPNERIREVRFDSILALQNTPFIGSSAAYLFRKFVYKKNEVVSNRDEKSVMVLYDNLVEQIRRYSALALERLLREGRITKT